MFKITNFRVLNSFLVYYREYMPSVACSICTSWAVLLAHLLASHVSADWAGGSGGQPTLHQNSGNHLGGNPAQGDALVEWSELTRLSQ